jgi:hypothetical protein
MVPRIQCTQQAVFNAQALQQKKGNSASARIVCSVLAIDIVTSLTQVTGRQD